MSIWALECFNDKEGAKGGGFNEDIPDLKGQRDEMHCVWGWVVPSLGGANVISSPLPIVESLNHFGGCSL